MSGSAPVVGLGLCEAFWLNYTAGIVQISSQLIGLFTWSEDQWGCG